MMPITTRILTSDNICIVPPSQQPQDKLQTSVDLSCHLLSSFGSHEQSRRWVMDMEENAA